MARAPARPCSLFTLYYVCIERSSHSIRPTYVYLLCHWPFSIDMHQLS